MKNFILYLFHHALKIISQQKYTILFPLKIHATNSLDLIKDFDYELADNRKKELQILIQLNHSLNKFLFIIKFFLINFHLFNSLKVNNKIIIEKSF